MQFQGQTIRIGKKSHFLAGEGIRSYRFAGNAKCFQLFDCFIYIICVKSEMSEPTGFRIRRPCGRIHWCKDFKLSCGIQFEIELPVFLIRTVILSYYRETEFIYIEIS